MGDGVVKCGKDQQGGELGRKPSFGSWDFRNICRPHWKDGVEMKTPWVGIYGSGWCWVHIPLGGRDGEASAGAKLLVA